QVVGEPASLLVVEDAAQRARLALLQRQLRVGHGYYEEAVHPPWAARKAAQEGMAAVAAEDLLAAVAGKRDLHLACGLASQEVERDVRRPRDRRVAGRDKVRQVREDVTALEHDLVMLRPEMFREAPGGCQFAALVVGKPGRKGGDAVVMRPRERHD